MSLRWRWKLSTIPGDCRWYAVVWVCWMLSRLHKVGQWEEVYWAPWSEVMTAGALNLATHPRNKAFRQSTVVEAEIGMAWGQ
jgi:hypothetical protein